MPDLIVIGYPSAERAEEVRQKLVELQGEYVVDLADAVVATTDAQGRIKLSQMVNTWAIGASSGSFWGLLVGLLFLHPVFGVVVGAASGLVAGALTDYGINDAFMKRVSSVLQPGQAALFVFARNLTGDKIVTAIAPYGGTVMRTNLNSTEEQRLRDTMGQARDAVVKQPTLAPGTPQAEVPR